LACWALQQRGPHRHAARHEERILPSAYFGTPVILKKKSFHSLYFDKDCRTLATSKAKTSPCTIFPAEQPERFYALADELVRLNVDILFTVTRLAALAAQRATKTIPIVFVAVADPVGSKLISSIARPGGNITGLANMALELTPKRFELLKEVVGLSKAALLVNAADPAAARYVELSNAAVGPLGVTVEPIEVRTPDDFGNAFSEISKRGLQGVATSQDGLIYNEQPQMWRCNIGCH
jgi:hypothetical protein